MPPKTPERDNDGVRERLCSKCGRWLPATEVHFYERGDSLSSQCKQCYREYNRQYRDANREAVRERNRQYHWANRDADLERVRRWKAENKEHYQQYWKARRKKDREASLRWTPEGDNNGQWERKCGKCGRWLPLTDDHFYKRGGVLRGPCKQCILEYQQQYYEENRQGIQEYSRQYAQQYRQENRDAIREWKREWYKANREKVRKQKKQYYDANWEKEQERTRRRRVRKLQAGGIHTAADIKRQYKAQRGRCYYCGVKVGKVYHVDHVIPLSRGGSDGPENLVIACPACNLSKSAKLPHEWAGTDKLL